MSIDTLKAKIKDLEMRKVFAENELIAATSRLIAARDELVDTVFKQSRGVPDES